jgi:oxaloacetate decarboxylase (Na+ extruding) subunit gamma
MIAAISINFTRNQEEHLVIVSSLIITVVGMLVVFAFLILLVGIMKAFSSIVVRFFPEQEGQAKEPESVGAEIAAAIAVAYDRS